jgi:photosystem II stability/assembly factor-like uncharacterized protein
MKKWGVIFFIIISSVLIFTAAGTAPAATETAEGLTKPLTWRLIGPGHMSGRITDIAVSSQDKFTLYCAAATGGIWKSGNNGISWRPIFDQYDTCSIGDIAVSPSNPQILWAGTGEANASSYTSWGHGVYKSVDGGENWTHAGLTETHHIGRVVIDPENPDIVYAAALGHLWGPNPERGLFKTTDGGRTWNRVLFISEDAGVADIVMDPRDRNTLYAAAYARRAEPYDDFDSMGIRVLPGSGLYKTRDGGLSWEPLTNGLPGDRVGRIGLAIASSAPDTVYAVIERTPYYVNVPPSLLSRIQALLNKDKQDPRELEAVRKALNKNIPDAEKDAAVVSGLSRREQLQLRLLLGYGELDTGGGIFRTDNGGDQWRRVNPLNERAGYYSQLRVNPQDPDHVYALMVRTWESRDGGLTFRQKGWAFSSFLTSDFIHGDFHALWIDPEDPRHMLTGTDGGLYTTYDEGKNWEAHSLPLGQFVAVTYDQRDPYYVYGGLQDNGCWGGPSAVRHVSTVTDPDWFKFITGDGAYVQVDHDNPYILYGESQYGNIVRIDMQTGKRRSIRPRLMDEPAALRFNYVAPFLFSAHYSGTLYMGSQFLLKSMDRGENWSKISPDLTGENPSSFTREGATITTIAESSLQSGLLAAGTDDGHVWLTRDDGASWEKISKNISGLPVYSTIKPHPWVSRVETSHHYPGTVYAAFDGHRNDDFSVYLYITRDFGQTWSSIGQSLPEGFPVNVIREDPVNENLLFAGTENAVHVSFDQGKNWIRLMSGMPAVAVDDLKIHPRDADLIAGTHGRGIYILDIHPLQQMTPSILDKPIHLFTPENPVRYHIDWTKNRGASGAGRFTADNPFSHLFRLSDRSGAAPPGVSLYYYVKNSSASPVSIHIANHENEVIRILEGPAEAGLNRIDWDLRSAPLSQLPEWRRSGSNDSLRLMQSGKDTRPGPVAKPGQYSVRLVCGSVVQERPLVVRKDTRPIQY